MSRSMNVPVGYTCRDLNQYFGGHAIKHEGKLYAINPDPDSGGVYLEPFPVAGEATPRARVKLSDITWENFRLPEMGYKISTCGKHLWYTELCAQQGTTKGVCSARLKSQLVWPAVAYAHNLAYRNYPPLNPDTAALYATHNLTYDEGMTVLRSKNGGVGVIFNSDTAMLYGTTYKYILHYRGLVLGRSADGYTWTVPVRARDLVTTIASRIKMKGNFVYV